MLKKLALFIMVTTSILLLGCSNTMVTKTLASVEQQVLAGNMQEAITTLDAALEKYPQEQLLLEKKADLFFLSERYDEFLLLRSSLDKKEQTDKLRFRSAIIASIREGKLPDAKVLVEQKMMADGKTPDILQLQGQIAYSENDYEKAINFYDEALTLDPNNQEALVNKSVALADGGQLFESLTLLDQALEKNPTDYLLRYNKGTVLSDIGYQQKNVIATGSFSYFSDALRHFEKAYTLNPNYTNTLVWLGISYLDLNNYDKAHTALDVALSKDQTLSDAWYYKGKVYLAEAKDKEAIATFKKLLTIDPSYELAKQELTLLEVKNKQ